MKNKFLILIIIIIIATLGLSTFLSGYKPTITLKLSSHNTANNSKISQNISVVAILDGPKSVKEGENVLINWKITNNHNVPITNVSGIDQNEFYNFGQINPVKQKHTVFSWLYRL